MQALYSEDEQTSGHSKVKVKVENSPAEGVYRSAATVRNCNTLTWIAWVPQK